jgi:hypothetical protein
MSGILEAVRGSLDAVKAEQEAAAAAVFERYEQTVVDVAAGKDVPPADVVATLTAVGKSMEQFERDVSDRKHFDEWEAAVAKEPEALARKAKLDEIAAEFIARRQKIQAELQAEAVRIGDQQDAVNRELQNIRDYKRRINVWNTERSEAFKKFQQPAPVTGRPTRFMTADEANQRYDAEGKPHRADDGAAE